MWDEITNPFSNFNSATVEVWEWINIFIPHFILKVITYPCYDFPGTYEHLTKRTPKPCIGVCQYNEAASSLEHMQCMLTEAEMAPNGFHQHEYVFVKVFCILQGPLYEQSLC